MGLELHGAAWIALRPWDMGAGSLRTCRCAFSTRSSEAGFANGDVHQMARFAKGVFNITQIEHDLLNL